MKQWIMPRGAGKTTALINESANTGQTIVAPTSHGAAYVETMARGMGKSIPTPISATRLFSGGVPMGSGYLIDELDLCLATIGVKGYTNTPQTANADEVRRREHQYEPSPYWLNPNFRPEIT